MPFNTLDLPARSREDYHLRVYRDKASEFRWQQKDRRNSNIVGAATEGYKNLAECVQNCFVVTGWLPDGVDLEATWEDAANGIDLGEQS